MLIRCVSSQYSYSIYFLVLMYCTFATPQRPAHGTVLCHPTWQPTHGVTEFASGWGEVGFETGTAALLSGILPLTHLFSL
jgi:hypothetical protein